MLRELPADARVKAVLDITLPVLADSLQRSSPCTM